jgi:hypothetical protein
VKKHFLVKTLFFLRIKKKVRLKTICMFVLAAAILNCVRGFNMCKKVTCKLRPGKIPGKILNSLQPYNMNN